jgi:hypothetical protein
VDREIIAAQCCSDVVDKLPERLVRADQCWFDAVSSKFKLICVFNDRSFVWSQCCCDVVNKLELSESKAAQCAVDVVAREPERDIIAAQCSRDAVDNKSSESRVLSDRSVA